MHTIHTKIGLIAVCAAAGFMLMPISPGVQAEEQQKIDPSRDGKPTSNEKEGRNGEDKDGGRPTEEGHVRDSGLKGPEGRCGAAKMDSGYIDPLCRAKKPPAFCKKVSERDARDDRASADDK